MTDTDRPFTVTEITRSIKRALESSHAAVSVVGEISNIHRHSSGHWYFSLKDAGAQLSAVMFRGNTARVFFRPEDGMEVQCRGGITVYEPRGAYQLLVTDMAPRGEGALQAAFERLKRRLAEEGLFDAERKRALPAHPRTVALVTSPTGAALQDMLSVIRRRDPSVQLLLVPVAVQGPGAAEQIAAALDQCNAYGDVDVIITGRGGGSIEDLWPFNEEAVARAIARSRIPVVSAVGHEVDFSIADFTADLRAATPSVAGELVVPDRELLTRQLHAIVMTLQKRVLFRFEHARRVLESAARQRGLARTQQRIDLASQRLDDRLDRLQRAAETAVAAKGRRLDILGHRLAAADVQRILRRGFALVTSDSGCVSAVRQLHDGERIGLRFHDGETRARIETRSTHDTEENSGI